LWIGTAILLVIGSVVFLGVAWLLGDLGLRILPVWLAWAFGLAAGRAGGFEWAMEGR
jgi:hypothetical protein